MTNNVSLDPQYAPFCQGYTTTESVAYYNVEDDYGYQEEDMWYDEEYDEWLDPNDPCYENRCEGFTDADWYASRRRTVWTRTSRPTIW